MTSLGQEAVVFWSSFLGSRLTSVGARGNGIGGDGCQHLRDERILFARSATGRVHGCRKVPRAPLKVSVMQRTALTALDRRCRSATATTNMMIRPRGWKRRGSSSSSRGWRRGQSFGL